MPPPTERIHKRYRKACAEFADAHGYDETEMALWFEQFTFMRMKEQHMPVNLAAWFAWRDLQAFFWTPGRENAN